MTVRSRRWLAIMKGTGRTMSVKREAVNALLGTRDYVFILAKNPGEYRSFAEKLGGMVVNDFRPDLFDKDENYNLSQDKRQLQKIFMKAYLILKTGFYRQGLFSEALLEYDGQAEKEAEILGGFATLQEALVYAKEHPVEMQLFIETMKDFAFQSDRLGEHRRLTVMGFETEADLLVRLDYLWNHAVRCLKQSRRVWVFVDCVDELLYSGASGDYLFEILERSEILKIPMTIVAGDVVHIVTDKKAVMEFDHILDQIRCFKLLSLGPVERKKFVERLNIPRQLVSYFTDRVSGEGILVTPSANIAVNDRFEETDSEFYKIFL